MQKTTIFVYKCSLFLFNSKNDIIYYQKQQNRARETEDIVSERKYWNDLFGSGEIGDVRAVPACERGVAPLAPRGGRRRLLIWRP